MQLPRLFHWKFLIGFGILTIAIILGINAVVNVSTRDRVYQSIKDIPANKVGLVLGTAKYLENGQVNLYYRYRVEGAVTLFQQRKIEYILVSGDNSRKEYNEPKQFREDLIRKGIPAERIFLDYAGFRTLDSIVRLQKVFGQSRATIISQEFHNQRAIFIAQTKGIDAIAYNVKDVSPGYGVTTRSREFLARSKMMLDLYVLFTQPRYLGEKVVIG